MAIVKMSKIKLVGLSKHRNEILDALHKTGCVEVVETPDYENTVKVKEEKEKERVQAEYERLKSCIDFITENIEKSKGKSLYSESAKELSDGIFTSYEDFNAIIKRKEELFSVVSENEKLKQSLFDNKTHRVKLENEIALLTPYKDIKDKLGDFKDTERTKCFFGTIKEEELPFINKFIEECGYAEADVLSQSEQTVISLVTLKDNSEKAAKLLSEHGFSPCRFDYECTAAESISSLSGDIEKLYKEDEETVKKSVGFATFIKPLKILCDYIKFQLEKLEDEEEFSMTAKTFVLTGYTPEDKTKEVKAAVEDACKAVFIEFLEPLPTDNPPTLLKNNPVVRQTEFVTEMYSVPNYRELDPNKVVFFFFMLFMGVIMADIGYGIAMIIIGLVLARRIKVDNGTRRLWFIITIGGVFAVLFGVLFDSFFGIEIIGNRILPNPVPSTDGGGDMTDLMAVLLMCLGLGVFQIAVGYFCKAINCFMQKDIIGGICDGLVWVLFFIGLVFAATPVLLDMLMPRKMAGTLSAPVSEFLLKIQLPALITVGVTLLIAVVTAGRKEKFIGKFTKGFGQVYGLINIISDILSYARLFGLMLSGMIIAQTFNDIGMSLINGGGVGYVFGALVIIVGHLFNLSMNVLGAYIHDSRLQYIEFFGKFYTGEGDKFTPLGSRLNYVYLTK